MNMVRFLQFVVLAFGVKEFCNAMSYYQQKKKKWAAVSLCMGVFACGCAFLSMTGIL